MRFKLASSSLILLSLGFSFMTGTLSICSFASIFALIISILSQYMAESSDMSSWSWLSMPPCCCFCCWLSDRINLSGSYLAVLDKTATSEELLSGVAAFGEALPRTLEAALSRIIIVVRQSAKRALLVSVAILGRAMRWNGPFLWCRQVRKLSKMCST